MHKISNLPDNFEAKSDLLAGRVILITGANGAIGEPLAKAAARCGAQLILAGNNPRKLNRLYDQIVAAGGAEPVNLPIDLLGSGPDEFAQVAAAIAERFGYLDGIVHLASVFKGLSPLSTISPQEWAETLHLALNAPFLLHQALLPLLQKSSAGRVVFAVDEESRVSKAYWGAYGVAKHALSGLISIMAEEVESSGIRVNGVRPPAVQSKLRQNIYMGPDPAKPRAPSEVAALWLCLLDANSDVPNGAILGMA